MKKNKFFFKIFLSISVPTAILFILMGVLSYNGMKETYEKSKYIQLKNCVEILSEAFRGDLNHNVKFPAFDGMRITLMDKDGKVLSDSEKDASTMENHGSREEIIEAIKNKIGIQERYSKTLKQKMIYTAMPIYSSSNTNIIGFARVSLFYSKFNETINYIYEVSILIITLIVLLSIIISYLTAKSVSKPIGQICIGAENYSKGNFDFKIGFQSNEMMKHLASSLEKMAQDLKQKIADIQRRKNESEEIISNMNEGLFICSNKGNILKSNDAFAKVINKSKQSILNKSIFESSHNMDFINFIKKVFAENTNLETQILFNGSNRTYKITGIALPKTTATKRFLFVLNDISDIRKMENMRKDFVSSISHELKTPITSIKGFVETLKDDASGEQEKRFLDIIDNEAVHLDNLVNDMLLLSKIEFFEDENIKNFDSVNLENSMKIAINNYKYALSQRNIKVNVNIDKDINLQANSSLIEIAFGNLIGNSAKYANENSCLEITGKINELGKVEITFKDESKGISQADLPHIFERFYKADKSRTRSTKGTGLGLAIVKHILSVHCATISASSKNEKGSTFTILF